ncbi:MAG: hypothetical protein IPK08_11665 [Bacteroidetes bacterium]|nr:hypothetical protein [Bacteroidota bacterium]
MDQCGEVVIISTSMTYIYHATYFRYNLIYHKWISFGLMDAEDQTSQWNIYYSGMTGTNEVLFIYRL